MEQVIANALISASAYLLVGLGFSLVYRVSGVFHFAHGAVLTCSAYAGYSFSSVVPLPLGMLGGVVAGSLLGWGIEALVYRSLRDRDASGTILLLGSLGIYVVLQASVALWFGAGTHSLHPGALPVVVEFFGARITRPQIATFVLAMGTLPAVWLVLRTTTLGRAYRAIVCDKDLARTYGIDVQRVILYVFLVASVLAGVAGQLAALDGGVSPTMGFRVLVMGLVAAVIGGLGSVPGVGLGAVILAFVQHGSAWWLSSQWQDAIVFGVLIVFLVARPHGLLGRASQSETVA